MIQTGPQSSDFFRHMLEFILSDWTCWCHHSEFSMKYGGMGNTGWGRRRIEAIRQPGRFTGLDGWNEYERRKDTK